MAEAWRLGGLFSGAHGASAPPPSLDNYISYSGRRLYQYNEKLFFFSFDFLQTFSYNKFKSKQ